MDISFESQVVVVTGAGGGLGRSYALDIARRGGAVVVNDLGVTVGGRAPSHDPADDVVAEIRAAGGLAIASYDDVATPDGGRRTIEAALDSFGRVDAVISNAGNLRNAFIEDLADEDLGAVMETHLYGAFHVARAAWPHLKSRGYGRLVFTSSAAGMLGNAGQSAYGAAKAGITGLMNVLSQEGSRHGILCNALQPNALSRMVEPMASIQDEAATLRADRVVTPLASALRPEFNTALAVYLASSACTSTHSIYSTLAGRVARVFIGVTPGWQGSRTDPATAEDIAHHIDAIRALDGFAVPDDLMDEYAIVGGREAVPAA